MAVSNVAGQVQARRLRLALASEEERRAIYRQRHTVYALELGQHQPNADAELRDALDARNQYIVATEAHAVVGFISVTPPGGGYSIDKYFDRAQLPFAVDDFLHEVRLLTVAPGRRGSITAMLLMYAALRWIESRGGTRVAAIGRSTLVDFYRKCALQPHGVTARCGAVEYELMSASVAALRARVPQVLPRLAEMRDSIDWQLPCPMLAAEACFHGGAFFEAVGEDFATLSRSTGVVNADVLDAWFPPAPTALAALQAHLPWLLRTSPPQDAAGLVRAIAAARAIPGDSILVGAGSSNLIYLAFREWLGPHSRVLLPDPAYGEYAHVLEQVIGCRVDRLACPRSAGFRVDARRLLARLQRGHHDLAILVNPNNPSGQLLPRAELAQLAAGLPAHTRLWVDEAYIDYAGAQESVEALAAASERLFVCKSLSKVLALSGARAAYLCGNAGDIRLLRRLTPPWAVSLPAQVAAVAALGEPEYYRARYAETAALRGELAAALRAAVPGMQVIEGVANFVLCLLPPAGPDAQTLCQGARSENVFLRNVGNMGATLGSHALRIAVKDRPANARVAQLVGRLVRA